ncbi:MAG: hypothetical protein ACD_13C00093G0012 [uncultured bacterium]|nr:MAG: hypothetical protein ACD_13C00093G0012 [uncultured bacterium]
MPNQNQPDPSQTPQTNDLGSAPFSPQTDLPPTPTDFSNVTTAPQDTLTPDTSVNQAASPVTPVTPAGNPGSAAPPPDFSNITSTPKKKFGTGKIIATILGIFALVGGVAIATYTVGQKQLFQQKAVYPICENLGSHSCVGNVVSGDCFQGGQNNEYACYNLKGNPGIIVPDGNCLCPSGYTWKNYEYGKWWCFNTAVICDGQEPYAVQCSLSPKQCDSSTTPPVTNPTTPPTAPPTTTASCSSVTTFDADWNTLASTDRSSLKAGDVINLCVSGSATSGSFDMARFIINGVQQSDTTMLKPGTTQKPESTIYCQSYTIPEGTTTFSVTGQVHHATLGWF